MPSPVQSRHGRFCEKAHKEKGTFGGAKAPQKGQTMGRDLVLLKWLLASFIVHMTDTSSVLGTPRNGAFPSPPLRRAAAKRPPPNQVIMLQAEMQTKQP